MVDDDFRVKRIPQSEYTPLKNGYFNSEETCGNYNLVLGYTHTNEPAARPARHAASSYKILKNESHVKHNRS